MKVYIATSDNSNCIIPIYSYLFNKYWSAKQEVVFLGFTDPQYNLPKNFSFVSMADEQIGGIDKWTTYLNTYLSSIDEEYFVFACDDHLIPRAVDIRLFDLLETEITNNPKIGRIGLTPAISLTSERAGCISDYKEIEGGYNLICLDQQSPPGRFIYRITGQYSIWNRKYFLKNMQKHWSPAQWEIQGGRESENDGYDILATRDKWCVKKMEALSGSQWPGKFNLDNIHPEDVEYILKNNLIPKNLTPTYIHHDDEWYANTIFGKFETVAGI